MADIDLKKRKLKKYECLNCGSKFKGIGKAVICPTCMSKKIVEI